MGCYDSVFIDCDCGDRIEFQSKRGPCDYVEYDINTMPVALAADLQDESSTCKRCGKTVTLKMYFNVHISVIEDY